MKRHLPSLNAVRAFDAAARHRNFTRAAHELGVAQPAVTRHVANLEDWLGTKLFRRTGNAVELSTDGYEIAELVTTALDRLELGFGRYGRQHRDEIVIGASFGMTHLWLMPQITAMRDAARGSSINFLTSENYSDYESARLDFSVRFGNGKWPGKRADLIFTEKTYVIVSPGFLERHPSLDRDNLAATIQPDWLLDHGDPFNYGWMTWRLWYLHHGLVPPRTMRKPAIGNYPTLLDMVRCGEGIALGYVGLDNHLVGTGEILRLGPPLHRPELGYYLLSDLGSSQKTAVQELRNYLIR